MATKRGPKRYTALASQSQGRDLAEAPSVSAALFQARNLLDSLEAFTESDYPRQTLTIAYILKLLARRAFSELIQIDEKGNPIQSARVRDLGSIIHVLNSYLRYLQASDPLRTPPGIQHAISLLIDTHGRDVLSCNSGDICVLVRPQWTYNLKYIDIIDQLDYDVKGDLAFALDPESKLGVYQVQELIETLWKRDEGSDAALGKIPRKVLDRLPKRMPKHVAVLSFAGMDRDDVLLYPLLAHELGHFLDFASDDIGKWSTVSKTRPFEPTMKEVADARLTSDDYDSLIEKIRICLREITADLLAARMVGLSYLFAFNEFFKTLSPFPGALVNHESGYPGFGLRLKLIFNELQCPDAGIESIAELGKVLSTWDHSGKTTLNEYIEHLQNRVDSVGYPTISKKPNTTSSFMENTLAQAVPVIQELVRDIIPADRSAMLIEDVGEMVDLLAHRVPPFQPPTRSKRSASKYRPWKFHQILTAGWLYQLAVGEERERRLPRAQRFTEYRNTCLLLLKALELQGAQKEISAIANRDGKKFTWAKPACEQPVARGQGVVSGPSIREALDREDASKRLVICPDLGDGPIESASRDLHLGHWFRISRRTSLPHIDVAFSLGRAQAHRLGQHEVFVPAGGEFVLQPGDFGLAASLEYICLPSDMMAFVEGKSSLGRTGLLIATATQIAPGFKGCIVLELFNAGTVPIILRPAMRVAQLVLVSTDREMPSDWLYSGGFQVQIKP